MQINSQFWKVLVLKVDCDFFFFIIVWLGDAALYQLSPPQKKKPPKNKQKYNGTFSINNFYNCEIMWIYIMVIKL